MGPKDWAVSLVVICVFVFFSCGFCRFSVLGERDMMGVVCRLLLQSRAEQSIDHTMGTCYLYYLSCGMNCFWIFRR